MEESSRDDTLEGVWPAPVPGRGAVSSQSSRDTRPKRSQPESAVQEEGRAISARDDVLSSIRKAVAGAEPAEVVPRDYRAAYDVGNVVDRFADMVADYKATVCRVGRGDLAAVVAEEVGGRRVGVPAGLPTEWYAGIDAVVDAPPLSTPSWTSSTGRSRALGWASRKPEQSCWTGAIGPLAVPSRSCRIGTCASWRRARSSGRCRRQ
jgi:hypothetical protein